MARSGSHDDSSVAWIGAAAVLSTAWAAVAVVIDLSFGGFSLVGHWLDVPGVMRSRVPWYAALVPAVAVVSACLSGWLAVGRRIGRGRAILLLVSLTLMSLGFLALQLVWANDVANKSAAWSFGPFSFISVLAGFVGFVRGIVLTLRDRAGAQLGAQPALDAKPDPGSERT